MHGPRLFSGFRSTPWRSHAVLAGLLILALVASVPAKEHAERIGLVLGGGGARGAAHVGVLKVLEEQNIAVDFIVGTSMGSIVGALYASGFRADEIETILNDIDWEIALRDRAERDLSSPQRKIDEAMVPSSVEIGVGRDGLKIPQGMLQGQNLGLLLHELLGGHQIDHFDDLPIPFRAVAADLVTGERVVLESGNLAQSVRASMSVPGVFQPVRLNGRILVDGGIIDNVPVDVAREMGATRLIVVDVGSGLMPEDSLQTPAAVTMQVIGILMDRQTQQTLELIDPSDVVIRPELGDIGSASFDRSTEAVPIGEQAARQHLDALAGLRAPSERWARFTQRSSPDQTVRQIDQLFVEDRFSRTAFIVRNRLQDLIGQAADPGYLRARITELYGEGHYQSLHYDLQVEDSGHTTLIVTPVDKRWGPNFLRLGLRLSDDFDGNSAYQIDSLTRFASDVRPGSEWRLHIGLGQVNEVSAGWRLPFGERGRAYFYPDIGMRAVNQPLFFDNARTESERLRWTRYRAAADIGVDWNSRTRSFFRLERGQDQIKQQVGTSLINRRLEQDYGFAALGLNYDSLDDAAFPSRGLMIDGRVEFHESWLGSDNDSAIARFDLTGATSFGRYIALAGVRATSARDDDASLQALDFLGGLGNLSGFSERELAGPQLFLGRLLVMRQLGNPEQLFSLPAYLGVSVEAGNTWQRRDEFDFDDLIYSGSIYLGISTPLGPIFLGYGRSDSDREAVYLNFGSLIRTPRF